MATTYTDPAAGWRAYVLQARTDTAGSAVDDAGGEDLRTLVDAFFTEGVVEANAFQVLEDSPVGMTVVIGSGTAKADHAVIDGDISGQGAYLVRMEDATVDLTVPAADLSNPRIDEVYLVVQDNAYDSSSRVLPRIAYRDGTPATSPSAPGPDAAWDAYLLVATISVAAGETEITNAEITDERVTSNLAANTVATTSLQDDAVTNSKIGLAAVGTSELADSAVTSAKITDGTIATADIADDAVTGAKIADGTIGPGQIGAIASGIEVDNSTEVAGVIALTGTFADLASVTLSIPATWNSWKCEAWASYSAGGAASSYETVVRIDGTDQQVKLMDTGSGTTSLDGAVGGRRTGLTTTGSRTVSLRARETTGGIIVQDIYLYARAVRTS